MSGIGRKQKSGPEYSKVPLWVGSGNGDCNARSSAFEWKAALL